MIIQEILFYIVRCIFAAIVFLILAPVIGLIMLPVRFIHPKSVATQALIRNAHKVVYMLSACMLRIFSIEVKIMGRFPMTEEPIIVMPNHVSWLDMFVLAYIFHGRPTTAISKIQNFYVPVFGQVIWAMCIVFVERNKKDTQGDLKKVKNSSDLCKKYNLNLLYFSEGTRTLTGKLGKLSGSGFHLAKESGMKILPLVMSGLYEINNKHMWWVKPGKVLIAMGPLYDPTYSSVEQLKTNIHNTLVGLHYPVPV